MASPKATYRVFVGLLVLGGLALTGCDSAPSFSGGAESESGFNFENCTIHNDPLIDGGVGRNGIPSLSNPSLVGPESQQVDYLADTSRVIGLLFGETPLAVPHNILWYHEIANFDDWAGRDIAVTLCPLTGSSLAFDRDTVDGATFGVSGLLFENNLVMYDRREEESLWPQMSRQASCGANVGTNLEMVPVIEMQWDRWKALHPDTKVVSRRTGFPRNYKPSGYPYGNYDQPNNDRLLFEGTRIDERRPPKERVLGIPAGEDGGLALPYGALDDGSPVRVVTVTVGGMKVTVFWNREARGAMAFETSASFSVEDGCIVDDETGSTWTVEGRAIEGPRKGDQLKPVKEAYVAFWFAWAVFQSATQLWEGAS